MLLQNLPSFLNFHQTIVAWPLLVGTYIWVLEQLPLLPSIFLPNWLLIVPVEQPVVLLVVLLGAVTTSLYYIDLFDKLVVRK